MTSCFAEVAFPVPVDHAFTYRVPPELKDCVQVGSRVLAALGNRRITGFVVGLTDSTNLTDVREVEDVLDPEPVFSAEMLQLARWIAEYYLAPLGEVLRTMLPPGIHLESKRRARLADPSTVELAKDLERKAPKQAAILKVLSKQGESACSGSLSIEQLKKRVGSSSLFSSLNALAQRGLIEILDTLPGAKVKPHLENFVRLSEHLDTPPEELDTLRQRAPKQARCLEVLLEEKVPLAQASLLRKSGASSSVLKALATRGLIEIFQQEVMRDYYRNFAPMTHDGEVELNREQRAAVEEIQTALRGGRFQSFLLRGVTGSGKTQVYIEAIAQVLSQGRGAIVLVPEISLTPQTVSRFKLRFGEKVAVFHSRMSAGERYDVWRRIRKGEFPVAIGARSAVFAPMRQLGLIVVDEEQEGSYKQDTSPRYHARDVALMRAKFAGAVVVLGSATPSTESYFNAREGKYRLLKLPARIDNVPLPEVRIVDMLKERKQNHPQTSEVFSHILAEKIEEKLKLGEQVILLQNRRGYSTCLVCKDCGHVERCKNCNITLTYHLKGYRLRCHYCGYTRKAPEACPKCGGVDILFRGVGTQKVEEELRRRFPQARVVRMDLDTTVRKGAHDRILRAFAGGEYDILLGTQMIAKGLDFPRVTLVGVILADTGLLFPDFRAGERTFQLLTQVAGRAGRKDRQGEVVIQTYSPDHKCLVYASRHDVAGFFQSEIQERKTLGYPPYGRLIHLLFRGVEEKVVITAAEKFARLFQPLAKTFRVLGPTPSPLSKLQQHHRWQLILKSDKARDPTGKLLREALRQALRQYEKSRPPAGVKVSVDVDPLVMW